MATDLETRSAPKQSEASLQRKFADLSARVKRVDLVAHVLVFALVFVGYALLIGWFDWFVGGSKAPLVSVLRWTCFGVFVGVAALVLMQTVRCLSRRVNPYFVAHQLERTYPDAKNSLINWLDLHDQSLPSAFQKHLSTRAAEHLAEIDAEQTLPKRRNRILLGALGAPTLGLAVLLALGPTAFLASMLRAFVPFYTPPEISRTQITLLEPAGDAEVGPAQAIAFAAKIDGRIPASHRPDAPRLLYRYQTNEDYFAVPLQADGAGTWTAQLLSEQVRTGFFYKIAAGEAQTPEHQVRVRGRAHVKQFEITYHYRPYLKHAKKTDVFPNKAQAAPLIHGLRGTEVDLIVRASRPVKRANIEITSQGSKVEAPTRMTNDDPHAFACRFTLEQSGHFRVRFTAADGEENVDRGEYPIDVRIDDAPAVVLTKPGADVSLAVNGTLEIEGRASDDFGVKSVALHVRVVAGPHKPMLAPKVYRPGKSFQSVDGKYPDAIEYQDFLALDELKDDRGTTHFLSPGTVLEYWLEATDNADYPNPTGNVGKSAAYKVTLTPKANESAKVKAQRDKAQQKQKTHEKRQDDKFARQGQKQQSNPNDASSQGQSDDPNQQKKQNDDTKKKLDKAAGAQDPKQGPGEAKGNNQPNADKKDGPNSKDGPQPKDKSDKQKSPGDAGNNKEKGEGQGGAGQSKAGGSDEKKQDPASKGERKDGPKDGQGNGKDGGGPGKPGPMGQAKSGGPMGNDAPAPQQPKDQASGNPMPKAKGEPKDDPLAQDKGNTKSAEPDGPDANSKDAAKGPMPGVKGSKANEFGANDADPKQAPPQQANDAGGPRDKGPDQAKEDGQWERVAKLAAEVAQKDKNSEAASKELADLAKNSDDPRKREIARDILDKNGRDPDTGKEKKKFPNLYGSGGKTQGISDDIKADAANREFARRIGQMQLDDWKKRITPDVLKKAGMSEADYERFVKNLQAYDALVQKRNAELLRKQVQTLRGNGTAGVGLRTVEGTSGNNDPLERRSTPPPELRDVQDRFTKDR